MLRRRWVATYYDHDGRPISRRFWTSWGAWRWTQRWDNRGHFVSFPEKVD